MAKTPLTDRKVQSLKAAPKGTRYQVMDTLVPGFGVRVTDKGVKTYIFQARFPGSTNPARREINKATLEKARDTAREWSALIKQGVDPAQVEETVKEEQARVHGGESMMSNILRPRGWHPASLEHRLVDTSPMSVDETTRSVSAILSTGAAVQRFYGREVLTISKDAIDTERVLSGTCPMLDSHQADTIANVLGRVGGTWIKGGALWGRLLFGLTPQADLAWGMVRRNEISGISVGYRVTEWSVTDSDGREIDQELAYSDAASFTYNAVRWQLLEASLVSVGADAGAGIRGGDGVDHLVDVRARMQARQNITDANSRLFGV